MFKNQKMEYENPDSTVNNESTGRFSSIEHQQEERVSSSTNPIPTVIRKASSGGVGVAPKLILKSMGSGSFRSTAVPNSPVDETDHRIAESSSSSSVGHHLQKMNSLVDDIKSQPVPVPLPKPRFLTSGVRNFLKPRRSVPPLTPLSTAALNPPVAESKPHNQMNLREDEKLGVSELERELKTGVELKRHKDNVKSKNSQSTLVVSSSPSSHPGIKLHIRREFESSLEVDNVVSCEDDLSSSVFPPPVTADSNVANIDSFSRVVNVDNSNFSSSEVPIAMARLESSCKGNNNTREFDGVSSKIAAVVSYKKFPQQNDKKLSRPKEKINLERNQIKIPEEIKNDQEEEENTNDEPLSEPESKQTEERFIKRRNRKQVTAINDDQDRRPQRKRKPTKHYTTDMVVPRLKIRKKKDLSEDEDETAVAVVGAFEAVSDKKFLPSPDQESPPLDLSTSPTIPATPTRGRGRGTGRGRGRPRGSVLKVKPERVIAIPSPTPSPIKSESVADTSIEVDNSISPTKDEGLPLEGDSEVNASLSSDIQGSPRKPRGRGRGRGSGTPRIRGSPRGTYTPRGSRGSKKSPTPKKVKPPKVSPIKVPPPVQVFEEETRMSADIRPPAPVEKPPSTPVVALQDEESRASNVSSTSTSTNTVKAKKFTKDLVDERKPVTAETMYEYQWPPNDSKSEYYFLQEQISEFLGVKSFRRKYPELQRRIVEMEERDFLRSQKIVSETQCDLGLTAINSAEVLDILFNDFPEKYEDYRRVVQERREQELTKSKAAFAPGPLPTARDRSGEFMRRIMKSCAKWNANFNRERKEERSCSFDLQTGTLNYPAGKHKILPPEETKKGFFPVSVLPGQYCDNYKSYTPTELKYLPLNTVMFGPVCENGNSMESDESGSESDDSSSSEDSSSSSSEDEVNETKKPENGLNIEMNGDTISNGRVKNESDGVCRICAGTSIKNKDGRPEVLIHCAKCDVANHPTCLELTLDMVPFIKKYNWQCTDCKNCIECNDPADEDKMLFCDCCDRGYHIYCVGLRKVPNGRWHCRVCSVCHSCNATAPAPEDRMAEWHHEFRKGEKGYKYYLHSFCTSCHKIYKKGQYCPMCLKCHLRLDDKNLLECRNCEKWVHKECVNRPLQTMFGFMCDSCDSAFKARTKLPSRRN